MSLSNCPVKMSAYEGDGCIEQERAGEAGGARWSGDGKMTGEEAAEVLGLSPSMGFAQKVLLAHKVLSHSSCLSILHNIALQSF